MSYQEALFTLRWFVTFRWKHRSDQPGAIDACSRALALSESMGDKTALWTVRWLIANKWGEAFSQTEAFDLITDVLSDDATHIDLDMLPSPGAELHDDEKELNGWQPTANNFGELQGMKVAIPIGHNRWTGAQSHEGDDEWTSRKAMVNYAATDLATYGVQVLVLIRDRSLGYGSAMRKHGREIDAFGADIAVEAHFNAGPASANGVETIVCSSSSGKVFAPLPVTFSGQYPGLRLRHNQGVLLRRSGRGAGFCRAPKCPATVWEPQFSSNPKEWNRFDDLPKEEGLAMSLGLLTCLETIKKTQSA